jgi:hypothetical protein
MSVQAVLSGFTSRGCTPRTKGRTSYTLQAGCRGRKQGLTHLAALGTAFPTPPVLRDCFTFGFFQFYLPAVLSSPPATLSEHRLASFFFFFLALLPATR